MAHGDEVTRWESLERLLEIHNPGDSVGLGPRSSAFAAKMAADAASADPGVKDDDVSAGIEHEVATLRKGVAAFLAETALEYPTGSDDSFYTPYEIGGLTCQVMSAAESPETAPTLVVVPGGGFCLDNMGPHKAFLANIAAKMNCNVVIPNVPLAPEHRALEVIAAVGRFMVALAEEPGKWGVSNQMELMGWSSGGNLALTAALNLQKERPDLYGVIKQLLLLSPWIDLSMAVSKTGPFQKQQAADTMSIDADGLGNMAGWYLDEGIKGSDPRVCPAARGDDELCGLPKVSIAVGGCEGLLGDAVWLADILQSAGVETSLNIMRGQTHNYPVIRQIAEERVSAIDVVTTLAQARSLASVPLGDDDVGLDVYHFNAPAAAAVSAQTPVREATDGMVAARSLEHNDGAGMKK